MTGHQDGGTPPAHEPTNDGPGDSSSDGERSGDGVVDVVVGRCAGCGIWVRYERMWGFDRTMRQVGMFQAHCSTCGWQHTTLTPP